MSFTILLMRKKQQYFYQEMQKIFKFVEQFRTVFQFQIIQLIDLDIKERVLTFQIIFLILRKISDLIPPTLKDYKQIKQIKETGFILYQFTLNQDQQQNSMIKTNGQNQNIINHFFVQSLIASLSAAITKTITSPFQIIKLRLSIDKPSLLQELSSINKINHFFQNNWRGNCKIILRYAPHQALNFGIKGLINRLIFFSQQLRQIVLNNKKTSNFLFGGVSGVLSLGILYSLDFTRTKLSKDSHLAKIGSNTRQYKNLADVYKQIIKKQGIKGIYNGFLINAIGVFVYRSIYFGTFDSISQKYQKNRNTSLIFLTNFCIGILSTLLAFCVSYPFDTIRRRIIISEQINKRKGIINLTLTIYRQQGLSCLFKGISSCFNRCISGALLLAFFEKGKTYFHLQNENNC